MDAISSVTTNSVREYLLGIIDALIRPTGLYIYSSAVQHSTSDLPAQYVYVHYEDGGVASHTLSPCAYKRNVEILVEINVDASNYSVGSDLRHSIENKFLQRFDQYSIIVHETTPVSVPTLRGTRFALNIALDYIY